MGRVDGKIALVAGAARGQGRRHAVKFAEEDADVIVLDICEVSRTVPITRSPRSSSWLVSSRPNPLLTPVMSQVRAVTSLSFRCGRRGRPRRGLAGH